MNKKMVLILLFCIGASVLGFAEDFNLIGWKTWGGVRATIQKNKVTLNGKVARAGMYTEGLNTALRGKVITLAIQNAEASVFSMERMIKITVNKDDRLIHPDNVTALIEKEYVPFGYDSITFTLPEDFDGKIGFVFYDADLKGLAITATYE